MAQDRTLTPPAAMRVPFGFASIATLLAVFIALAKLQEIVPPLAALRPALLSISAAFGLTLLLGGPTGLRLPFGRQLLLYLALTVIALATVPFSVWPGGSLDTILNVFVPQLMLLVAIRCNFVSERHLRWLFRTLVLSMVVLAAGVFLVPEEEMGRVSTGSTYDANDLGLIFVCCLPLAIPDFAAGNLFARLFAALALAGGALALLRTGSRGALVGLAVAGLYFVVRRTERLPRWLKLVGAVAVTAILAARISGIFAERIQAILSGEDYNLTTGRLAIWAHAVEIALQRPFGVGPGQFGAALGLHTGGTDWHTAHNTFLQVLVELGFAGLLVFALILWFAWRDAGRTGKALAARGESGRAVLELQCARTALVGYLAAGMFLSQAFLVIVPVLVGALAALRTNVAAKEPGGVAGGETVVVAPRRGRAHAARRVFQVSTPSR